jgi:mRNA-degrading endonuclease YafQ of YafQ-DinJ toxin-antitoxin module
MSELKVARFAATKQFDKAMAKLSRKRQERVKAALTLALDDIASPQLRLHGLKGDWLGAYSLDAGGDLRILFDAVDEVDDDGATVTVGSLITVGTHSQIYG